MSSDRTQHEQVVYIENHPESIQNINNQIVEINEDINGNLTND